MAELWTYLERLLVASIVLGAVVYLYLHWSGTLARMRDRKRPDVRASDLVRKKPTAPPPDDDCCR